MPTKSSEPRAGGLSKQRIVDAAIHLLDEGGEKSLTFRVLTEHLSTGAGAIYWHVSNKSELLHAATEGVITRVVSVPPVVDDPRSAIRSISLGVFDALQEHPWVGAQLVLEPWQPALLHMFDAIGRQLRPLGIPAPERFNVASAITNYVLGVAGQYAAGARLSGQETDRTAFLTAVVDRWSEEHDADTYPFMHEVADQLAGHDDRAQFLAGVDILLNGTASLTAQDGDVTSLEGK